MLYAEIINDEVRRWPIREHDLRKILSNVSFPPGGITNQALEGTDFVAIPHNPNAPIPLPTIDTYTFVGQPVKNADGVWERTYQSYTIVDPDFKAFRAEKEWERVRAKRNKLLSEADAAQSKAERDVRAGRTPATTVEEIDNYKDALCAVPEQADPFQVLWPTKPF